MFNKKIILSILILGTVASMAGAGTFAWFTDTGTSNANTFTSGTLFLNTIGVPANEGFDFGANGALVYPGAQGSKTWTVANGGTLNGKLRLTFNVATPTEGTATPVPAGSSNLNTAIHVVVKVDDAPKYTGDLAGLGLQTIIVNPINAGTSHNVKIEWNIPGETDNGIQGDSTNFVTTFNLIQLEAPDNTPAVNI